MAAQRRVLRDLPFALFYVLPYVLGCVPEFVHEVGRAVSAADSAHLAYAIVRYRLMDVDIIFRRAMPTRWRRSACWRASTRLFFSLGSVQKISSRQRP